MPTDTQGAALLALYLGTPAGEAYRGKRVATALWANGWINGFHEVTADGCDVLATWLLRGLK